MSKTPANLFFENLHRELILRGIWGSSAKKLLVDLREHLAEETENQIASGCDATEAQSLALQKLGAPAEVAAVAAQERIRRVSWIRRSFTLRILLGVFIGALCFPLGWMLPTHLFDTRIASINVFVGYDIGVFLIALLFITVLSLRSSLGWSRLLPLTLAIATTAAWFHLGAYTMIRLFAHHPAVRPLSENLYFYVYLAAISLEFAALATMPWFVRHWKLRQLQLA